MGKFVLLGIGLLALAIGVVVISSRREDTEMLVERQRKVGEVAIPPIDAAAPEKTETATFAMG
jgi:hypothetical protein